MDWANESWVKLYTRNTAELVAIGWEARALLWELMRVCDRSGYIDTADPEEIAVLCHMPSQHVTACHRVLLARGIVTECDGGILITNFLQAQTSRTSSKERQRRSRELRKAEAESVTARHTMSQHVTGRHDKIDRVDRIDREKGGSRDGWSKLAQSVWQKLNDARSELGMPSLGLVVPPGIGAEMLARIGEHADEDGDLTAARRALEHVVDLNVAEAKADRQKRKWLDGGMFGEKRFGAGLSRDPARVKPDVDGADEVKPLERPSWAPQAPSRAGAGSGGCS